MALSFLRSFVWFLACALTYATLPGCSHGAVFREADRRPASVDAREFLSELPKRVFRVAEFREIRKWANANGLRVWLGGGSATGLTSYLREELLERSRQRAPGEKSQFTYAYFDIYRSTQDADIVIDGDEAAAQKLEKFLVENLGYLQGSKNLWEVRLLKYSRGHGVAKKDALLGDPSFRGQNSDSFSLGLVEITDPPAGESRVRDLFDWENQDRSRFLTDLLEAKVTFIRSPDHAKTARAEAGYNPEVISAIRAYTKAFQYDAVVNPDSLDSLKTVVAEFDPRSDFSSDAVRYIKNSAFKLFQHARDLERAANELDRFGLRKKLIDFAQERSLTELAVLLSREPLRTFPLGSQTIVDPYAGYVPSFLTARQLGITRVAHETKDFLAYENITMSRTGKANLFVSRAVAAEEAAAYGDGAYTRIGNEGARGTRLTIRFEVHPDAVEGRDFFLTGDYLVFRNSAALKVLPSDQSHLSMSELVDLLDEGGFGQGDLGVIKKLELQTLSRSRSISEDDTEKLLAKIRNRLKVTQISRAVPAWYAIYARVIRGNAAFRKRFLSEIESASVPQLLSLGTGLELRAEEVLPALRRHLVGSSIAEMLLEVHSNNGNHPLSQLEIAVFGRLLGDLAVRAPGDAHREVDRLFSKIQAETPVSFASLAGAYSVVIESGVDAEDHYLTLLRTVGGSNWNNGTILYFLKPYLDLRSKIKTGKWKPSAQFDRLLESSASGIIKNGVSSLAYTYHFNIGTLREDSIADGIEILRRSDPARLRTMFREWILNRESRIGPEILAQAIKAIGGLRRTDTFYFPSENKMSSASLDAIGKAYPDGIPAWIALKIRGFIFGNSPFTNGITVSAEDSIELLGEVVQEVQMSKGLGTSLYPIVPDIVQKAFQINPSAASRLVKQLVRVGATSITEDTMLVIASSIPHLDFDEASFDWLLRFFNVYLPDPIQDVIFKAAQSQFDRGIPIKGEYLSVAIDPRNPFHKKNIARLIAKNRQIEIAQFFRLSYLHLSNKMGGAVPILVEVFNSISPRRRESREIVALSIRAMMLKSTADAEDYKLGERTLVSAGYPDWKTREFKFYQTQRGDSLAIGDRIADICSALLRGLGLPSSRSTGN